jgi:uncharacterized membrane protein YhaH (DUF805 family)
MTFQESIATCIANCFDFAGEATRSEFWWFFLFVAVVNSCIYFVSPKLSGLFFLLALLPALAVTNRRLHDTNHSGWWQLAWLFPFVGWLVLAFFFVQEGDRVAAS